MSLATDDDDDDDDDGDINRVVVLEMNLLFWLCHSSLSFCSIHRRWTSVIHFLFCFSSVVRSHLASSSSHEQDQTSISSALIDSFGLPTVSTAWTATEICGTSEEGYVSFLSKHMPFVNDHGSRKEAFSIEYESSKAKRNDRIEPFFFFRCIRPQLVQKNKQ